MKMDTFILNVIAAQGRVFGLDLQPHTAPFRIFKDKETLALCLVIISCSLYLTRSLPKTIQIISLCILPLGAEVYIWDRSEFWIHVSLITSYNSLFTRFSNADLLYLSSGLFIFSTLYIHRQKFKNWKGVSKLFRKRKGASQTLESAEMK